MGVGKYVFIGVMIVAISLFAVVGGILNFLGLGDSGDEEESDGTGFWWPIGSAETTTVNGKLFASGEPSYTGEPNSPFGSRWGKMHNGIDIACPRNTYLIAVKPGKVVELKDACGEGYYGSPDGYGNYVKVQHDDGMYTFYAHMEKDTIVVSVGGRVTYGQVLGQSGNSGSSTGPHLHFEIRKEDGTCVDPMDYISLDNPRPKGSGFADMSDGILVLINPWSVIEDNSWVPDDLVVVEGSQGGDIKLQAEAAKAYREMKEAARREGVTIHSLNNSGGGHRTYEYQEGLYGDGSNNAIAAPNASEHRTGLAIDLITVESWGYFISNNSSAWKWLCNNAMDYGFILRYPLGCEDTTGIAPESWHWRYIGKEHAQKFYEVAKERDLGTTSREQHQKGNNAGSASNNDTVYYLYTYEEYYEEFVK